MRKILLLSFFAVLCALPASAQYARYSAPFPSVDSINSIPFLVANIAPNLPTLSVCAHPANQVPCTNYATTYTSLGVACPNGSQDTPDPQPSACQGTGDAQGNIGFWAPPGEYDYTVCIQNSVSCFGPYTVTLAYGGGSILLATNGTANSTQSYLNLTQGQGLTVADSLGSTSFSLDTQYTRLRCETGLGDGFNAITADTYLQTFCFNDSQVTWTITGIKCFTDNAGSSTLNATDNSANALLTGAITCSTIFAAGTQSTTTTIAAGGWIKFTFVADGTSKQTTWVVSMTQ